MEPTTGELCPTKHWQRGSTSMEAEASGSSEQDDALWDPALRRNIRSEQRKIINEVHSERSDACSVHEAHGCLVNSCAFNLLSTPHV
jgi:hypothetical protein